MIYSCRPVKTIHQNVRRELPKRGHSGLELGGLALLFLSPWRMTYKGFRNVQRRHLSAALEITTALLPIIRQMRHLGLALSLSLARCLSGHVLKKQELLLP